MQLRYQTALTGEQYVSTEAWRGATLDRCSNQWRARQLLVHPARDLPAQVAARDADRALVLPQSRTTFSLLPDYGMRDRLHAAALIGRSALGPHGPSGGPGCSPTTDGFMSALCRDVRWAVSAFAWRAANVQWPPPMPARTFIGATP